ncbi:hypothetical protein LJ725_25830 [Reyranella aquatilis]|uniref:SD-repeat containing protein B domain-containing protein n=1 Tax=Reyranella aquatilis TaxID=2035356 RepID=A0ABS8L261_9HYPH|nr:carboxypeptidase-like regulatory domain-containing protein [Reyranella aquatilis]MCC8432410.1 hypothetical protein [Reyranella aquatilis]
MNDRTVRTAPRVRRVAGTVSTLLAMSLVLAASPALSQGAMGPGGGAMTPQPRVAPAAPQAPTITPQAPVVAPQVPQMPVVAPSVNQPVPQPQTRSATSNSNRDHIDQDAQTDIKKLTTSGGSSTGGTSGPQKTIRVINNSESDTATVDAQYSRTTGAPTGPAKPQPNYSNNPIPGIDVVVQKKPAGNAIKQTTGGDGQTTFRQLEPGTYDVALPKLSGGGTLSMTVFVNGTPASRTDFPVGSSTGTFTVAKASDTVMLKFQTNSGQTPVNGVGGTGGGRYTFK